jgi:hypothetical protein
MKITRRDIIFFVLGIITFLLVELIFDFDSFANGIKDGMEYSNSANIEIGK